MKKRFIDTVGVLTLRAGAIFTTAVLTLLIVVHFVDSARFFAMETVHIPGFLTGREWRPSMGLYGARGFFSSSLRISVLAVLFALPGSFVLALYIAEYAELRSRRFYLTVLEVMASLPTVVFGLFALMFVTPLLQSLLGLRRVQPYNALSAALVLSIFLTPQITNSMAAVLGESRNCLRNAALALGATRSEAAMRIVIPDALPGLSSALILGFSRAFGESVIVGMVAGAGPRITANPLEAAETLTGFILRTAGSHPSTAYAMGSVLFLLGAGLNLLGEWTSRRSVMGRLR